MNTIGSVFSIGYQNRSIDEFVMLLTDNAVDILVDVRETPWSHRREYAKTALTNKLADAGIEYYHAKFAGNPKEIRRSALNHNACLADFSAYLDRNPEIVDQFDKKLGDLVRQGKNICLVCYERHPDDCHRTIVIKSWIEAHNIDAQVTHLGSYGAKRFISLE